MDTTTLRELMHIGRYQLKDEEEILRHRSDKKARLKWIRSHEPAVTPELEWGKSQDVPIQRWADDAKPTQEIQEICKFLFVALLQRPTRIGEILYNRVWGR